jgi:hypothetical protein
MDFLYVFVNEWRDCSRQFSDRMSIERFFNIALFSGQGFRLKLVPESRSTPALHDALSVHPAGKICIVCGRDDQARNKPVANMQLLNFCAMHFVAKAMKVALFFCLPCFFAR